MAAVIVRGLCRQRRSQQRKQPTESPPLYQHTLPIYCDKWYAAKQFEQKKVTLFGIKSITNYDVFLDSSHCAP